MSGQNAIYCNLVRIKSMQKEKKDYIYIYLYIYIDIYIKFLFFVKVYLKGKF